MQVVFVTVTSVYTKVCVVVARYSNAVPYFHGVLSVCRPFPPTVVYQPPVECSKGDERLFAKHTGKDDQDKTVYVPPGHAEWREGKCRGSSRPCFHIKRPRTLSS